MLYQEELRKAETLALWAGDFQDEDAVVTYLGAPFERDFGFLLDDTSPPEYACVYPGYQNRRRMASSKPIETKNASDLFGILGLAGPCLREALSAFAQKGFQSTKVIVVFLNLGYRPELCRNPNSPLRFVCNVSWPDGRELWEMSEKQRLVAPPFPKLVRRTFGDGDRGLFHWEGIIRLPSWGDFATYAALASDQWSPTRDGFKNGDMRLIVYPIDLDATVPTEDQARALQHLLDNETASYEAVLAAIFQVYPNWRENYFGEQLSGDGGKTWQKGWDLPDMFPPDNMPAISSPSELRLLIRPGSVHIMANPKDGFTRVGFGFRCKWDEEHGLGVSTHRGVVIEVGAAETAFDEFHP